MKCYVCAKMGKDTDAVAACIVCGMGVCMEHANYEETPVWKGDYPVRLEKDVENLKRIMCPPCHEALKENW
ncbi:MAG: DUF2180 family protein [Candidatus Methanoperedens sp.]|nr:DUF2180 family protein [Candidatus Methanoperedens sp.]